MFREARMRRIAQDQTLEEKVREKYSEGDKVAVVYDIYGNHVFGEIDSIYTGLNGKVVIVVAVDPSDSDYHGISEIPVVVENESDLKDLDKMIDKLE